MEFNERIRQLRKEKKETQAQVAEAIGIQPRHYQRFELGENLPGYANLIALADHYLLPADQVLRLRGAR